MWDEGRRLEEVRVGNTVEAEFLYAIDDRRVRRIADGVVTYYLGDGSEYTIDGANSYFTYFHSVNGRMVAFTKSDTDVTTWMGADIVNSTSNTRDENGVTAQQRYTPFGEVRIDGNLSTDHTYTGQVNDETTGLAFYNARYYDPATARFITPDSIVPNPNDGQDYNRYTYVRNNPVRFQDPTGHCVFDAPCLGEAVDLATGAGEFVASLCVAGTDGCSDQNLAEIYPDFSQGIVNASAGYLDAVSNGLAEDLLYADIYVEEDSGEFITSNLFGNFVMLPVELSPAGRVYSGVTTTANVAADCTQFFTQSGSGADCAQAGLNVGLDAGANVVARGIISRNIDDARRALPVNTVLGRSVDFAPNFNTAESFLVSPARTAQHVFNPFTSSATEFTSALISSLSSSSTDLAFLAFGAP